MSGRVSLPGLGGTHKLALLLLQPAPQPRSCNWKRLVMSSAPALPLPGAAVPARTPTAAPAAVPRPQGREAVVLLLDVGPRMHAHLQYVARAAADYVTSSVRLGGSGRGPPVGLARGGVAFLGGCSAEPPAPLLTRLHSRSA